MHFPRFWAKAEATALNPAGGEVPLSCWGWSETSDDDARHQAHVTLGRLSQRVNRGEPFPERYAYGQRPVREEVVEEFANDRGEMIAVLTRNVYGALVLNAAHVLFIDVDDPPIYGSGCLAGWSQIAASSVEPSMSQHFDELMARVRSMEVASPELGIRIYRTAAGFRLVVTDRLFTPGDAASETLMGALEADRQYVELCRVQHSFRARLTPKYWRCLVKAAPPARYPFESDEAQSAQRDWEARYLAACAAFATCELVEQRGSVRMHPEVELVLHCHDHYTRVGSNLTLA